MRVLVFGDSITQGYWAVEHGWVDRVRKFYDTRQYADLRGKNEPTIFNLGISADNSEDILRRIENETVARTRSNHPIKPIIILQIGVNDGSMVTNKPQVSLENYRENLKSIIEKINQLSSRIIFIGFASCDERQTTPVSWGDYYYTNQNIKAYENIMAKVAEEHGIDFIPVFDGFKARIKTGKNLLTDGLHPNEEGHKLIYEIVKPKLEELLK